MNEGSTDEITAIVADEIYLLAKNIAQGRMTLGIVGRGGSPTAHHDRAIATRILSLLSTLDLPRTNAVISKRSTVPLQETQMLGRATLADLRANRASRARIDLDGARAEIESLQAAMAAKIERLTEMMEAVEVESKNI